MCNPLSANHVLAKQSAQMGASSLYPLKNRHIRSRTTNQRTAARIVILADRLRIFIAAISTFAPLRPGESLTEFFLMGHRYHAD